MGSFTFRNAFYIDFYVLFLAEVKVFKRLIDYLSTIFSRIILLTTAIFHLKNAFISLAAIRFLSNTHCRFDLVSLLRFELHTALEYFLNSLNHFYSYIIILF